ncbi:hypothetical protein C8R45DRAFT_1077695 [Mycena sanguinolenta]|nr:hypothetical protein C8R45DRAFT_1077695 [Mycena sanguinolenta]
MRPKKEEEIVCRERDVGSILGSFESGNQDREAEKAREFFKGGREAGEDLEGSVRGRCAKAHTGRRATGDGDATRRRRWDGSDNGIRRGGRDKREGAASTKKRRENGMRDEAAVRQTRQSMTAEHALSRIADPVLRLDEIRIHPASRPTVPQNRKSTRRPKTRRLTAQFEACSSPGLFRRSREIAKNEMWRSMRRGREGGAGRGRGRGGEMERRRGEGGNGEDQGKGRRVQQTKVSIEGGKRGEKGEDPSAEESVRLRIEDDSRRRGAAASARRRSHGLRRSRCRQYRGGRGDDACYLWVKRISRARGKEGSMRHIPIGAARVVLSGGALDVAYTHRILCASSATAAARVEWAPFFTMRTVATRQGTGDEKRGSEEEGNRTTRRKWRWRRPPGLKSTMMMRRRRGQRLRWMSSLLARWHTRPASRHHSADIYCASLLLGCPRPNKPRPWLGHNRARAQSCGSTWELEVRMDVETAASDQRNALGINHGVDDQWSVHVSAHRHKYTGPTICGIITRPQRRKQSEGMKGRGERSGYTEKKVTECTQKDTYTHSGSTQKKARSLGTIRGAAWNGVYRDRNEDGPRGAKVLPRNE